MRVGSEVDSGAQAPDGDEFHNDCPGRVLYRHVAGRWSGLIALELWSAPLRFHRLRDALPGISEKVLAQNLRELVRDGLLDRTVEPTRPPQVTYSLTPLGEQLATRIHGLLIWAGTQSPEVLAARHRHDTHQAS
ncbi:MAG: helix-turn-helix transcriptional regulator [Saccharothrix sp.]|nr:helix-turn-helix transcriptional regulator [Saccharothrix sp.]